MVWWFRGGWGGFPSALHTDHRSEAPIQAHFLSRLAKKTTKLLVFRTNPVSSSHKTPKRNSGSELRSPDPSLPLAQALSFRSPKCPKAPVQHGAPAGRRCPPGRSNPEQKARRDEGTTQKQPRATGKTKETNRTIQRSLTFTCLGFDCDCPIRRLWETCISTLVFLHQPNGFRKRC